MRYELPSFRIDKRDWLKGNNAYDNYPEGGALSTSVGMNSFSKPGLLSISPVLGSAVTASLPVKGVISWGVGSGSTEPTVMAVYTNASGDGSFYSVNPTTGAMTIAGTPDTGRNYTLGITDTVFYNNKFYTTSETDICEHSADLTVRDEDWWTVAKGKPTLTAGVPHPQLVYESIHYIADGKFLHKNDAGTISTEVFDVPPDHVITALVEYNGMIYIVAEPYRNLSGAFHGLAQMFSWDGLTESWYEQYFLDYRVNALYVYKNRLYAWTNQFLGAWTGSEMAPIRPVANQVFKCHITATSDSMIYADGTSLIRYGAPYIPGITRKFYNYMSASSTSNFAGILSISNDNLIVTEQHATASPNFYIADINTPSSTGARTLTFNERAFTKQVKVRGIVVETEALATGQIVKAGYIDDAGTETYPSFNSGEFKNATTEMAGLSYYRFEVQSKKATRYIKPRIVVTGNVHIRSIDYLYEGSENNQNK